MIGGVAVVGPGRVGTTLAAGLVRGGRRVAAVGGGRPSSRDRFVARIAGVRPYAAPADAMRGADLVLIATPDDVIEQVVHDGAIADAFHDGQHVVHVAGAHGLAVLRRAGLAGARVAACHPAQTVPAGEPDPDVLAGAAWAVTAAPSDQGWAHELVTALGGTPHDVPDDRRVLYHAGLAVAANAVGAAVAVARQLLLGARVDDPGAFLAPLIRASADNVVERGATALTGPVVRGDTGTVARHLAQLEADLPELASAYRLLSAVVLDQARAGLRPDAAAQLDRLLGMRGDG